MTTEAIAREDVSQLRKCMNALLKLKAPMDAIQEALATCPLSLLQKSGIVLTVETPLSTTPVKIGDRGVIDSLISQRGVGAAEVSTILTAQQMFHGTIEAVYQLSQKEISTLCLTA